MLHEQEREQDLGLRGEDSSSTELETMASCFALSGFINARTVMCGRSVHVDSKIQFGDIIKQSHRAYIRLRNKLEDTCAMS